MLAEVQGLNNGIRAQPQIGINISFESLTSHFHLVNHVSSSSLKARVVKRLLLTAKNNGGNILVFAISVFDSLTYFINHCQLKTASKTA